MKHTPFYIAILNEETSQAQITKIDDKFLSIYKKKPTLE